MVGPPNDRRRMGMGDNRRVADRQLYVGNNMTKGGKKDGKSNRQR